MMSKSPILYGQNHIQRRNAANLVQSWILAYLLRKYYHQVELLSQLKTYFALLYFWTFAKCDPEAWELPTT